MKLLHKAFGLFFSVSLLSSVSSYALESGQWPVSCGANQSTANYQITEPTNATTPAPTLFAIVLNGSPGTSYFSDNGSQYQSLVSSLSGLGYRVLEIKYDSKAMACGTTNQVPGLLALCCAQGLPATVAHDEQIYNLATQQLGYDPTNPQHQLLGFGLSLGALQLQTMAYISGKKFTKVGLTGILAGNSQEGCQQAHDHPFRPNGMSWVLFDYLADMITTSTHGCSMSNGAALEYTEAYNFDQLPYRNETNLGLFEGHSSVLGGHPKQAQYIYKARGSAPTTLHTYTACGHLAWDCIAGRHHLNSDILKWVSSN